ncbi:hypothetical protein UU5_11963, partial [Rhodanobacter sp. 115]
MWSSLALRCAAFSSPFEKRRTAEDQARRVTGMDAGQFDVRAGDGMDAGVEATQDAVARCAGVELAGIPASHPAGLILR